jgi:hypothetical protein
MNTISSTSLHNLPEAVTPVVFEALDPDSRKNLYASSSDVQALFSPAVSSLHFWLGEEQPDHQILAGLHPRVQPKRLAIRAGYGSVWEMGTKEAYGAQVTSEDCVELATCITTFANSPHSNRLDELRLKVTSCCKSYSAGGCARMRHCADLQSFFLQGYHLLAQSVPPPILHSLKVLVLKRVAVTTQVLADILSDCHQLEELQLVKTCLTGSSRPLAVLSNLALASLTLDIKVTSLPQGQQRLAFLQHLNPSLTTLDLHMSAALCSPQNSTDRHELPVFSYISSHLNNLKHLTISAEGRPLLSLAGAPVPQQLETLTLNCMELPDMQCAVTLLSMPNLRLLAGNLWFSEDRYDTTAIGVVPWPQGKPAMELQTRRAGVKQVAALPLEHFSSVTIAWLDLGSGRAPQVQANRVIAFQALLAAARKCPSFSITGMCAAYGQYPLMPALGEACPIRLSNSSVLECDDLCLDDTSVLGIAAAWGAQLKKLTFRHSDLKSAAWSAITPAAFPMLEEIELFPGGRDLEWAPEVAVLCMEWPADRKLKISVTVRESRGWEGHDDGVTNSVASQVQQMLRARGKHNILFAFKWHSGYGSDMDSESE